MKMLKLASAVLALSMTGALAAQAAPGFTTANVNHRTGPDTDFPSMGVIPEGTSVDVRGCLRDESWCDVIAGGNRGWVFSEYLALSRRGEYVPLPDIGLTAARVPVVTFLAANYWRQHYTGRPWFKGARPLGEVQAAPASRLESTAFRATKGRLVAPGLPSSLRHEGAARPRLEAAGSPQGDRPGPDPRGDHRR
jgi:uncharacterized protein YraI